MKHAILMAVLCAAMSPFGSAAPRHNKKQIALLVGTIAFSGVASYLDMRSSLGMSGKPGGIYGNPLYESSPWFASGADHGYHARGVITTWAITGGLAAGEYLLWRHNNLMQAFPETLATVWGVNHIRAWRHNNLLVEQGKKAVGK
jgi:hypothetical protein